MKVLFFARLREQFGSDFLELPDADCPGNVAELRRVVIAASQDEMAESMRDPNVFCAVNRKVVDEQHPLSSSDEIAFFPPMTGG